MKRTFRTIRGVLCRGLICLAGLLAAALPAAAEGTSRSYTYNSRDEAVPTASPYQPAGVYYGKDMGVDALSSPRDLYVTDAGEVYLLDSGNSRVVVLNSDLTPLRVIQPAAEDGEPLVFGEAAGISVCRDGRLLIADRKGQAVYILDAEGRQLKKIEKPDSGVIPENFQFQPVKAEEDSGGILYVLSSGSYSGALQFDTDGSFMGFYGSEKVDLTVKVLANYFWKNILSDKAAEGLSRTVPVEFVSFCIDPKDFIFTIRKGNEVTSGQVRKLNATGGNVLKDNTFGDHTDDIQLVDLAVDDDGFITVLDGGSGRLFQYDPDGGMLYAFAGKGTQAGCFSTATAVETLGEQLLVLDIDRGSLTAFEPTEFALKIREATLLYRDGKYQDAMTPWQGVLAYDNGYEQANLGMGKAYEGLGEYTTAMSYYVKGNDKDLYSDAFGEYRSAFIRRYFPVFIVLLVAAVAVPLILTSRRKGPKPVYAGGRPPKKYPFYCMFHPVEGYSDLKSEKSGSFLLANGILLAFFIVSILMRQLTGFAFNENRTDQFNLWVTLCSTIGVFVAFVLCNWAVTTILDGKGKFLEIWTFCAYALLPYVILMVIVIVLSNVLTGEEAAFYNMALWITYGWTAIAMLMAIREVHQYSLTKTVVTLLITFFALLVVVVIVAILYSVFSQFTSFIATLGTEITMHT